MKSVKYKELECRVQSVKCVEYSYRRIGNFNSILLMDLQD